MLTLPDKFKSALGPGTSTSLFPVVRFYKGVRIDKPLDWIALDLDDTVNLSIKDHFLKAGGDYSYSGIPFDPLLLTSPKITSSADIINNKYKISNVSLSITNAPYNGKIFSDTVEELLNAVCEVYYCSAGITDIEDCLLLYTGTVRRYSQTQDKISLQLEDLSQQMLSVKIPTTLVPDEVGYREEDVGTPYPMVYGYADKHPLKYFIQSADDGDYTKLIIDKPGQLMAGVWSPGFANNWENESLKNNDNHTLKSNGWLVSDSFLNIYDDGHIPIMRATVRDWGGGDVSIDEGIVIYTFEQDSGFGANVSLEPITTQLIEGQKAVPTRIYRPIKSVKFAVSQDDNNPSDDDDAATINRHYGFGTQFNNVSWEPYLWEEVAAYEENWGTENDNVFIPPWEHWWEPTITNNTTDGWAEAEEDENWRLSGRPPFFPVDFIQNDSLHHGIHVTGSNPEGVDKSGASAVKIEFYEIGIDYPCVTKYLIDLFAHKSEDYTSSDDQKEGSHHYTLLWHSSAFPQSSGNGGYPRGPLAVSQNINFPRLPNGGGGDGAFADVSDQYGWDDGTAFAHLQAIYDSTEVVDTNNVFDTTNKFSNVKWGVPFVAHGILPGNDEEQGEFTYYQHQELMNFYMMQDVMVGELSEKKYFGSIAGRALDIPVELSFTESIDVIQCLDDQGAWNDTTHIRIYLGDTNWNIWLAHKETFASYGLNIESFPLEISDTGESLINGTWAPNVWYEDENSYRLVLRAPDLTHGSLDGEIILGQGEYGINVDDYYTPIQRPHRIMKDIYENELGYEGNIDSSNLTKMDDLTSSWWNGFSMFETEEAKNVIEGLFKSSIIIPAFRADGQVKFIGIHQGWDGTEPFALIPPHDVIKYSFALTKLEDVKNQVNVKYSYDLGSTEYEKETGYLINDYETLDEISESLDYSPEMTYDIGYYNLSDEEAKLEVETKYIRDDDVAKKLQKRLLLWYANQHITTKLTLPVSYMHLEVGDYVAFSELLGGNKAFGYDYTDFTNKNGQLAYPYFFITKIDKSLESVSVEAVQMLRGDGFGFPDDWEDLVVPGTDAEGGQNGHGNDTVDGRGNDVTENYDTPDPSDNPDYGGDGTIDEGEEEAEELYLNAWWNAQYGNNLKGFCEAIVTTNLQREWTHELWITELTEDLTYMDADNVERTIMAGTYNPGEVPGNILWGSNQSFIRNEGLDHETENYGGRVTVHQKMELLGTIKVKGKLIIKDAELELRTDPIEDEGGDVGIPPLQTSLQFIQLGKVVDDNLGILPITYEKGDITRDGILNVLDVAAMIIYIKDYAGDITWEEFQEERPIFQDMSEGLALYLLDMNQDGNVNVLDVLILMNIILGQ